MAEYNPSQRPEGRNAEEFIFPVASGIIAGGALMGVALIFWENGPEMMANSSAAGSRRGSSDL